jgi:hypothetical protein
MKKVSRVRALELLLWTPASTITILPWVAVLATDVWFPLAETLLEMVQQAAVLLLMPIRMTHAADMMITTVLRCCSIDP